MSQKTKKQGSFIQNAPYQLAAGLCAGFFVSPINTIVDKAVIEYANGKVSLWGGATNNARKMIITPVQFFKSFEFRWIFYVYGLTYSVSNLSEYLKIPNVDDAVTKLFCTFCANSSASLIKDKALAQALGKGPIKPFPSTALSFFFLRDLIGMASAFTLPSIAAKSLSNYFGWKQKTALKLSQLGVPLLIQFIATPIHLLGLDIYNRQGLKPIERLQYLQKIYWSSLILRMLRFLPAYGFGGIVNMEVRGYFKVKEF